MSIGEVTKWLGGVKKGGHKMARRCQRRGGHKLTRRQAGGKYGVLMFLVYSVALDYGLVVGDGTGWQGVWRFGVCGLHRGIGFWVLLLGMGQAGREHSGSMMSNQGWLRMASWCS